MSKITLNTGAPRRVGFVGTRFHGTDGVSLEAGKWAQILAEQGHSCFWMGGLLDTPPEKSALVPLGGWKVKSYQPASARGSRMGQEVFYVCGGWFSGGEDGGIVEGGGPEIDRGQAAGL